MTTSTQPRIDVYARVTAKIIADLEQGVRTWQWPWNADNAAGNIIRPRRANGLPYPGVNVLLLWSEALDKGYTAPMCWRFRGSEVQGQVLPFAILRFRVRSCLLPSCADNAPLVRAPRLGSPLRCPGKVAKIHTLAYTQSAEVLIWLQSSAEFS